MSTTIGSIGGELHEYHGRALPSVSSVYPGIPRGYVEGLMIREAKGVQSYGDSVKSFVVEIDWNVIQPVSGPFVPSVVDEILQFAQYASENDKKIRLRLFAGLYAPDWVKDQAGTLPWYSFSPSEGEKLVGSVPIWWTDAYAEFYGQWQEDLVSYFGDIDPIVDVTVARCMTIYAEPMIRQWGSTANVTAARDAGYTVETDLASIRESMIQHRVWADAGVGSSFAFNPWQEPAHLDTGGGGGAKVNFPVTLGLIDYFKTSLGRCGVLENNSIGDPISVRGPRYQVFWEYMAQQRASVYPFPQPIAFQTMNTRVMSSFGSQPYATAKMVADLGANACEMPQNWLTGTKDASGATVIEAVTPEQVVELNAQFAANVSELKTSS